MMVPWLPVPRVPAADPFREIPVIVPGMWYSTQFHRADPSTGMVVTIRANSLVPAGAPDQESAGEDPDPLHVYSTGRMPPSVPALLVSRNVTGTVAGIMLPVTSVPKRLAVRETRAPGAGIAGVDGSED